MLRPLLTALLASLAIGCAPDVPVTPGPAPVAWRSGDTVPSGLEGVPAITVLEVRAVGSGTTCGTGRTATLAYRAMRADGEVLDPGDRPFSFLVGSRRAIAGWDLLVPRMCVGDSLVVRVPEGLAYPGEGDLMFEMELLDVR